MGTLPTGGHPTFFGRIDPRNVAKGLLQQPKLFYLFSQEVTIENRSFNYEWL